MNSNLILEVNAEFDLNFKLICGLHILFYLQPIALLFFFGDHGGPHSLLIKSCATIMLPLTFGVHLLQSTI
jgi:hypothetical protein